MTDIRLMTASEFSDTCKRASDELDRLETRDFRRAMALTILGQWVLVGVATYIFLGA